MYVTRQGSCGHMFLTIRFAHRKTWQNKYFQHQQACTIFYPMIYFIGKKLDVWFLIWPNFYDFGYVETPVLEYQWVFEKSLGVTSDVVEKEMFTLKTKGGDELALRPENTAPIMRAYLEHGWESLPQPVKVFI